MKKLITIILALITVCLTAITAYILIIHDNNAPNIEIKNSEFVYIEGTDTKALIESVQAIDDVDGDVSDAIQIEKMVVTEDKTIIRVQFVAKDKSNNISKRTFEFGYSPDPNKPAQNVAAEKKYNIVIVNNLGVENLANAYATLLRNDGHKIVNIGLSSDPVSVETTIYVQNDGDGKELLKFFPNSSIIVGNIENRINVSAQGADAFVILGWQHSIVPAV